MSKIFKVTLATTIAAFAFTASAATATFTTNMTVGSTGESVRSLQQFLNSCPDTALAVTAGANGSAGFETTYFGMATKTAVSKYQTKVGIASAPGNVGPMTRAAMSSTGNVCGTGTTTTTTTPGCPAGALFNSMTGASCTVTNTTSGLSGGAGSATFTELSSPSSATKVGEGNTNTQVYGVEIEADKNSDLAVTSMKLELLNSGSGSSKLSKYVKSVSVWYNGTKVGSATPSDFTEDSGLYTKSMSLSSSVIKAGAKGKFYVAVDALDDIDSGNTGSSNNTWTVEVVNFRYTDATGAILTETTGTTGNSATSGASNTFIFDTYTNTNDMELKVNLSNSNLAARTVKVSTTADTNQVELLRFTMKAQGSKMTIDQIPFTFTTSHTLNEVTSNVTLKIAGNTYNESVTNATSSATIKFDDLNFEIAQDATVEGVVYADVNDIDPNFTEGTTLYAALTSALVTATTGNYIDVEDINGDPLVAGDRTGSAIGEVATFRSTGVNTVMGTPSYSQTTDTNGLVTSVTYTIPVAVTAFGNTLYMGQTAQLATSVSASNAFNVVLERSTAPTSENVSGTAAITLSTSNATIETNGFRLDDGVTKNFTVTVNLTAATDNSSFRVRLDQIQTFTDAALSAAAAATASDLIPTTNFRTDYKYLNN